jgi:hypothetical protein
MQKKDSKQLEKIMLSSDEWKLLQNLIITLGPFEEATRYFGGEKYITHSIMIPIIERIKTLLLSPLSNSPSSPTPTTPTSPTSPTSRNSFNLPEIFQEIENTPDVFIMIEEVEILENHNVENSNNQTNKDNIDLDKLLETKELLEN